jgi:flagellar hook-associated protein 2
MSGLSSGVDTESVVKGMLSIYQSKIDKQQQSSIKLGWTADAYREVNTLIKNFRSKYMSVLSSSNMLSSSAYSDYSAKMLSTTSAVSVSAAYTASEGTYKINSITQLAESAAPSSTNVFNGTSYSSSTKLSEMQLTNGFEFDENGELSFSINDKTFTFTQDSTIGEVINAVNISGIGVRMSYSSLSKGFTIKAAATGSESKIEIVNISGNAFSATDSALGISEGTYFGKDAVCRINGYEVTRSANSFSIDGITYNLTGTHNLSGDDEPITFTVSRNLEGTVDRIKEFVAAYNELVDNLQSRVGEKVYRSFPPLADTQKEAMTEKEIELWEEKARSGMLRSDPYVSSLLSSLRSAFYSQVSGTGISLSDIGFNTGIYSDGAKITIDENKLRSAITDDPEKVKSLFTLSGDDFNGQGLITRMSNALLSYTKQTTNVALDNLEDRISDSKSKMKALHTKMDERERVLWQRFSAMETAMSKLNGMSSWLASFTTSISAN